MEYKSEGYELFLDMMVSIRRNVVYSLFQFQPQMEADKQAEARAAAAAASVDDDSGVIEASFTDG